MERARFIALHAEGLYAMSELCTRFGISRKTGYKWLARYAAEGLDGLIAHSRAPHACPHQTSAPAEAALVQARKAHPHWGPKKLVVYLARTQPDLELPAPSTAGEILQRAGLVTRRTRRRPSQHPGGVTLQAETPNAVWMADFKGEFLTGDGQWCWPLTATDAHSRFLLCCQGLASKHLAETQAVFRRLFVEYGLPQAIRTDNGTPFVSHAIGGLSRLNIWWLKLGIQHQRIRPGCPQENGRHERMHRTLKAETTRPPARDRASQQVLFDQFSSIFNYERPHEALGQQTPSTLYTPALRVFPATLPTPEYGGHFQVRRVDASGCMSFRGNKLFISEALVGEDVGLEEVDEGIWSVHFYTVLLGRWRVGQRQLHG
jgi:transposase InsO family protein